MTKRSTRSKKSTPAIAEPAPPPEKPAPSTKPGDEPAPPPPELVELGAPPIDSLEAQLWMLRAVTLSTRELMLDQRLSSRARAKEIRTNAATAAKLIPKARIWEAEQIVKGQRAELERRKPRGAQLEPVPPKGPKP